MLDLTKLAKQMPGLGAHLTQQAIASNERIDRACELFNQAYSHQAPLLAAQEKYYEQLIFAAATPVESLDHYPWLPKAADRYSIFATDGSQIAPSHHEIAFCYLINIGRVMLHYGQDLHPLLDSIPEVFYESKDLYESRQWGIAMDEWLGYRRTVSEIQVLTETAIKWVLPPGAHDQDPNLALVDGSLIYWFLESLPSPARDRILMPIMEAWEQCRLHRIPLMSYVSAPRSVDVLNFMRLAACTFEEPNCNDHCGQLPGKAPCQIFEPLRDATVYQYLLKPGQRSPIWKSNSRILDLYDRHHHIHFCYLHVGSEVARVEMPAWLLEEPALLEQSLGLILDQVYKGFGYPVSIAEAHNQAVVRGGDRQRFLPC